MAEMTYSEALNLALREEMRRDPAVFVMGEDVAVWGDRGGVFGVTREDLTIVLFSLGSAAALYFWRLMPRSPG